MLDFMFAFSSVLDLDVVQPATNRQHMTSMSTLCNILLFIRDPPNHLLYSIYYNVYDNIKVSDTY
ncbi:hypothetical protein D1872_220830 [compost metagenome]